MNRIDVIKSSRLFDKNDKIYIEYRLTPLYRTNKERERFSTGIDYNKRNVAHIEKKKDLMAYEHFLNSRRPDGDTFFVDIALKAIDESKSNRRESTHQDYVSIYNRTLKSQFGGMRIKDIKPADINKWANELIELGMSPSRFKKHRTTLNMIMEYAYLNEYIERNPVDLLRKPVKAFKKGPDRSKKYYTEKEAALLVGHAQGWFQPFLITLFYTGMRTGEAMALKWSDIDFEKSKITIQRSHSNGVTSETTKTNIVKCIDMSKVVGDALKAHYDNRLSDEWIFPSPKTKRPFYQAKAIADRHLKPLCEKLDIEYKTLYATRHTFASSLAKMKVPLVYVQKMLGHKKLSTTTDYYIKNGLLEDEGHNEILDQLYL